MLIKRWLTAIVLIPLLLWVVLKGSPLLFATLITIVSVLGMAEYLNILSNQLNFLRGYPTPSRMSVPLKIKGVAYLASPVIISAAYFGASDWMVVAMALNIICMAMVIVFEFRTLKMGNFTSGRSWGEGLLTAVASQIQGVIYIPLFLAFLVLVRCAENGSHWVIWLWLVIGFSDTGAYYVGTYCGKRPLSPHVSPNKSVEGAIGGLGAAALGGTIYGTIFIAEAPILLLALFSILSAAAGQLGDLFESALKRAGRIKDSGSILPGHGGVLDRLDGLIFAAPIAYIFKFFIL